MRRTCTAITTAAILAATAGPADAGPSPVAGAYESVIPADTAACHRGVNPRWAWCRVTAHGCRYRVHVHHVHGWGWEAWDVVGRPGVYTIGDLTVSCEAENR